jgi:hypothetical protein
MPGGRKFPLRAKSVRLRNLLRTLRWGTGAQRRIAHGLESRARECYGNNVSSLIVA